MTCIAAAVKDGTVCIGGDAVSVHRDASVRFGSHGKVFQVGAFLIGASGTMRTHQVMRYLFDPPPIDGDLTSYMVKQFIPPLRELMKAHGGECRTQSGTDEMDARYLVGVQGRLFEIDSGYGVFEATAPFSAVGSADQEALAAMFTVNAMNGFASAEEIVRRGLLAAAEFQTSIRPPFTIMTLPRAPE